MAVTIWHMCLTISCYIILSDVIGGISETHNILHDLSMSAVCTIELLQAYVNMYFAETFYSITDYLSCGVSAMAGLNSACYYKLVVSMHGEVIHYSHGNFVYISVVSPSTIIPFLISCHGSLIEE